MFSSITDMSLNELNFRETEPLNKFGNAINQKCAKSFDNS